MKKAMTNMFNVYDNIRTPKIDKTINISDWFDQIKESVYSNIIESARPFGKENPIYDGIKNSIPAITYNFTFHTIKSNANIIEGTGLLYLDIDDINYDISTLDTSKVFAYYKSFGGMGYSVLVKVENMTSTNYETTYEFVCSELGLKNFHDKGAKKKTQFNVLSYDPNIFINYESYSFIPIHDYSNDFVTAPCVIKKGGEAYTQGLGTLYSTDFNTPIRFTDLYDRINIIDEYVVNPDGWDYVKCWIPMHKINRNRNAALLSYCNNLVWINPQLTVAGAENIMNNVNPQMCMPPVDKAQIKRVVKSIFKQKEEGKLLPIYSRKKRKIVFAKYSTITPKEKFKICGKIMNEIKIDASQKKIYLILEGWDFGCNDKITIRAVAKHGKMNKKTVEKYWSEFKGYAKDLNDAYYKSTTTDEKVSAMDEVQEELPQAKIQLLETVKPFKSNELSDIKMDDSESFYVANHKLYAKAINLLTATPRVMFRIRMSQLIDAGYEGIEIFEADEYKYTINVYGSTGTIEFISLSGGEEVLLKVA